MSLPSHSSTEDGGEDEDSQSAIEYTAAKVGENKDPDEAYTLYQSLMEKSISVDEVCKVDVIQGISTFLEKRSILFVP